MKKITIIIGCVAFTVLAMISGCKKKRAIVEYDMSYNTSFVFGNTTANTQTAGVNNFSTTPVVTNISSSLESNRLNGNIVGEITCTNFNMDIKGPSGTNVKALKAYEFWMQAGTQKDVRVAYCQPWPSGVSTTQTVIPLGPSTSTAIPVTFNLEGTNLKNYFMENSVNVKLKAWADYTVAATYTVNASYTVHVTGIEQ